MDFEEYSNLEIWQVMYEHNMKFKQFVYIFEDFWKHKDLHIEKLERNFKDAEDARDEQIKLFSKDLESLQKDTIDILVTDYL